MDSRDETDEERVDRNLRELLLELRIAIPGVQILFAFLLTVPFQSGFERATGFERITYFATLLLTTMSAALLIAPTAFHRITFRQQLKEELLIHANRFMIAGLTILGLAMTCVVMLITNYLYGTVAAVLTTGAAFGFFSFFWAFVPLKARFR